MRINRQKIIDCFNKYTNNFSDADLMIKNKKVHSMCVANNCEWISDKLGLNNEEKDLAWLIGILHDIGRFEQIRQTKAYTDENLDHAQIGIELLFEKNYIKEFLDDFEVLETMKKAIQFHNKLELPNNLTKKEKLFCKIIRDADKIDNFRGFHENDFKSFHERTIEEVQESKITDGVMQCFKEHRTIPHSVIKTDADFFLLPYALYFGITFPCSYELIKKQGHYKRMLDFKFDDKENQEKFELIKQEINKVDTRMSYGY